MKKILILFGGNSHEHIISCKSAKTILTHIDKSLYNITAVGIDHQNNWYLYLDDINLIDESWQNRNIEKITNIIEFLKQFDKVFPIIHGNPEENGNIQGMFNLFNIEYVGTDLLGSIISYDKELNEYVNLAFKYDNKVIIEKYIKARELECAILQTNKIIPSPIGEIRSSNTFYDYEAKYLKDSSLIIPANINKELAKEITKLSKKIFNILSLSTLARIDFLYDYNEEKLYFNEVNTMPGFTDISMYPLRFKEVGIKIKNLITKIIEK